MKATKNQSDKPRKETEEAKLIEKYADEWCRDNGYPLLKRKWVYKGSWKLVDIKR
jgi:hypothetical protein